MLDDIDGYIAALAGRASTRPDGRDSIATLNAKMDYAEMVDATVLVLTLAVEELQGKGVLTEGECPSRPAPARVPRDLGTYDYIQQAYAHAEQRMRWARSVDAVFRAHDIAVLRPPPVEST
jgi:hypothetical protein